MQLESIKPVKISETVSIFDTFSYCKMSVEQLAQVQSSQDGRGKLTLFNVLIIKAFKKII